MSSSLRIIVTGLIAQDPLTKGFLENGFIPHSPGDVLSFGVTCAIQI
jgi:hypothetical protein